MLAKNPAIKAFQCPITQRTLYAVPPADPDVVVLHAIAADEDGNVLFPKRHLLPQGLDLNMGRGCDVVIVTVEKIVSKGYVKRHAAQNLLPGYKITMIVEAPFGAHPCPVLGRYDTDIAHFEAYATAGKSVETFKAYLDEYVYDLPDHQAYLEKVGAHRLLNLFETDSL
ncbi:Glutaconate CoA-transferase subunit A [compost metagenome]